VTGELEVAQLRKRVTQLEGKVAFLYEHLGLTFVPEPLLTDDPRVVDELKQGNLLKAIAVYRQINNVDLEDAKQAVQEMQGRLGL
jgi:hypothetical protein